MKNFLLISTVSIALLTSCKTSQLSTNNDDAYANPAEDRKLRQIAAAEKAKQEALEKERYEQQIAARNAAQRAKDSANPYYKDPTYNKDDYYDYQYASRVNRFKNPISGAGYYDPYYTNMYSYNQNPSMYGTSIYSSYNYGMPSSQFGNYSMGFGTSFGNGCYTCGYNNGYNNYGYNGFNNYGYNGYYNPYGYGYNNGMYYGSNYGYNSFGYSNGYNNGFYNGYNNGQWGYINSYDPNSTAGAVQYGPRGSNGGGNTPNSTSAGMAVPAESNGRQRYFQSVADQQNSTPRFSSDTRVRNSSESVPGTAREVYNGGGYNTNSGSTGTYQNANTENSNGGRGARVTERQMEQNNNSFNNNNANRSNNSWNNNSGGGFNSGGGGGMSPRNSGGGGGSRPR